MIKLKYHKKFFWILYVLIYVFSYLYLSYYHQTLNIFNINIHESGQVNFWGTIFYSSHFLAHIPVLIVIAFVFVGSLKIFGSTSFQFCKKGSFLFLLTTLFLIATFLHSYFIHGKTDTLEYIFQQKQGHDIYGEGGSWKLHLVSTVSILFLIPAYTFIWLKILTKKTEWNKSGFLLLLTGIVLIPVFSFLCEGNFLSDLQFAFKNNRYLAHSVRELATFPITYFPLFLLVFFDFENSQKLNLKAEKKVYIFVLLTLFIFILLFMYQVILPLKEGIGNLSQKPEFMKGESLPILYLLASHYFEHFLDTIFFVLFSGWLFTLSRK